jgi:hypothetical protein
MAESTEKLLGEGKAVLFLLGLLFLSQAVGPVSRQTNLACAALMLALYGITTLSPFPKLGRFWLLLGSVALMAGVPLVWYLPGWIDGFFLASFAVYSLGATKIPSTVDREKHLQATLLLATFLYVIALIIYDYLPGAWWLAQQGSQLVSHFVAATFGKRELFGATAFGLPILTLFSLFIFAATLLSNFSNNRAGQNQNSKKRQYGLLILTLLALVVVHALWVVLQGPLIQFLAKFLDYPHLTPMHLLIFLFLLDMIPALLYFRTCDFTPLAFSWRNIHVAAALAAAAFFLATVVLTWPDIIKPDNGKKNVFILNRGYYNWEKPKFGQYGLTSAGMFGLLPKYLQALDYNVIVDSVITVEKLADAQVLMVINLNQMLGSTEKEAIGEFVRSGHSLFVLGDHTGLGEMMRPLNDLLQTAGIQFNFDSAHYLKDGWNHTFEFMPHALNSVINNEDDVGISVGASLAISPFKARPVITAKYGFSDFGNWLNKQNAYLGDRWYNPGELLGDIVLVAEARVGKGKILVFGDTSSLQNGSLTRTLDFVDSMLRWLASPTGNDWRHIRAVIGAMLLLVIAVFFLGTVQKHRNMTVVIIVFGGLTLGLLLTTMLAARSQHQTIPRGQVAYIDTSHLERFEMYGDGGIWSLLYTLMRSDYLPFLHQDLSRAALMQSKVLFKIAPAKPLSDKERLWVNEYMQQGGMVVWTVGYEEKEGSEEFLNDHGFIIDNVPLGPIPKNETDLGLTFRKAWPVIFSDSTNVEVFCSGWGYPVIVEREIGEGRLVVIGDSEFLLARNLEEAPRVREENLRFIESLVKAKQTGFSNGAIEYEQPVVTAK